MTCDLLTPPKTPTRETAEFVVFESVPVFKEHVNRDGMKFGPEELRRICNRCNHRIQDTKDYPPVVLRHTKDDGGFDPPTVGFAGPFWIGTLGDIEPKTAIFTNLMIFKEDAGMVKRYPRLSVEYWSSEKDPFNGYFDPISLLGAETPELDLGVRYSKSHEGNRVMRYSLVTRFEATAPGGSNTFVPGGDDEKKPYSKETPMALSPDDISQLIEAMKPMVQQMIAEATLPPAEHTEPDGDEPMAVDHYAQMCGMEDDDAASKYFADLDDESKEKVRASVDGDEDQDRKMKMEKYMSLPSPESSATESPANDMVAKYQKEAEDYRTRYQKLNTEHTTLKAAHDQLLAETTELRTEKRKAVRYQKLTEAQQEGYVIDLEQEYADTADFTDEQFDHHMAKTVTKYQKVPLGSLPIPKSQMKTGERPEEKTAKYSRLAKERADELMRTGKRVPSFNELFLEIQREQEGKTNAA